MTQLVKHCFIHDADSAEWPSHAHHDKHRQVRPRAAVQCSLTWVARPLACSTARLEASRDTFFSCPCSPAAFLSALGMKREGLVLLASEDSAACSFSAARAHGSSQLQVAASKPSSLQHCSSCCKLESLASCFGLHTANASAHFHSSSSVVGPMSRSRQCRITVTAPGKPSSLRAQVHVVQAATSKNVCST